MAFVALQLAGEMLSIITSLGLLGCCLFLLVHFWLVIKYGRVTIGEPNPLVLILEIGLLLVLMTLAIINFVNLVRR